ncbi:MAG: gamma-glutamyltransferase [Clostridiaceae bacterium]|nr:gamma-glutamyltransferase [Clostridiaceae bacterium]
MRSISIKLSGGKWIALILVIALLLSLTAPAFAAVPGVDATMEGATEGIVAVAHPKAAEAGKMVLQQGGNAIDAAAAIQLALNVVEPMMSGIGGGGFTMIYLKDENKFTVIDSRELAPQNVDATLFLGEDGEPIPWFERHTSGKAVGVPGTLMGIETALEKYGTMTLSEVIDPAIKLAEEGVELNWINALYIEQNIAKLEQYGTAAEVFIPNGVPLKKGDLLVQPDLAKTLKLIKEHGSDVFYNGEIGEAIVAEVQKRGGSMTMEDMRNYRAVERTPVSGEYRGYEIVSMPPPSSGGLTIIQILKLMEGYDVEKLGLNSVEYLHRLLQAMHLSYADRAKYMADEDFIAVPKEGLINQEYINERRKLINPNYVVGNAEAGDPWKYENKNIDTTAVEQEEKPIGETTHFSVIDQWGNMVAYTTTIEAVFGAGIMVPEYGLMLNNELTDFDAIPGGVNEVAPGKRPLSSMSPTLVLKDGQPFMALGSPGGPTIITSVAQTILNVIDHKLPIQEAILAPRVYSSGYPTVRWEAGIDQDVVLQLMAKGHVFQETPRDIGNVQAVLFDYENNKMYGGADDTREGAVFGVDAVYFVIEEPSKIYLGEQGPFTLKINDVIYPYYDHQMLLEDGTSYILANKLFAGLGLSKEIPEDLKEYTFEEAGNTYLPVRVVAEALDYEVSWDGENRTVLLKKDIHQFSESDEYGYYDEDEFKITN